MLGDDPEREVLDGHPNHGLVTVDAAQFHTAWESWKQDIRELQNVIIYHDRTEFPCGQAHHYLVEDTETQKLQPYIKEILVEVAVRRLFPPNGLKGGKRHG